MAAPGSGEPDRADEVLDDGRGGRARRRGLADGPRRLLAGAALVAVAAAGVVSLHHPAVRPASAPARPPVTASPAPVADDVRLLTDQYSYSADRGSLSLLLSVVNYGTTAIQVLRSRLPQAGSRPLPGPGGDLPFASPITLSPDQPTELSVLARVSCPSVLTAPLADHIDVTLGRGGQPIRVASLSLTGFGSLLDDARHQACGSTSASGAIFPTMPAGGVRVVSGAGTGRGVIATRLRIRNVADTSVSVSLAGADPNGVTVSRSDGVRGAIDVATGHSSDLELRWVVSSCAALEAVRWPALVLTIRVPTSTATDTYGFEAAFGAAWRRALDSVCAAGSR